MALFGRHRVRDDAANNVTQRRRGWAFFNPYPAKNRTNPNNTYANTTRRIFNGRTTNDATRDPRRSRRMGRADFRRANEVQPVPLVTKVKRTLGIQSRGQQQYAAGPSLPVDIAGRPRRGGLFSRNTRERRVEPQRKRGWFSSSGGRRYRK